MSSCKCLVTTKVQIRDLIDASSPASDLREKFITMTPSKEFAEWCRFTDKHPEFLNTQSDAGMYANEAIKALESKSEFRAKLCIEKAVFLAVVGGKPQKDRDRFFEKFHEREKGTIDDFVQRYRAIEELCRKKVHTPMAISRQTMPPLDDPRVKQLTQEPGALVHRPAAFDRQSRRTEAIEDDDCPDNRRTRREATHNRTTASQEANRSHGPPIDTRDPAKTTLQPSIKGGSTAFEKLDPKYERRDPRRAGTFFTVGRVFSILEHVEADSDNKRRCDNDRRSDNDRPSAAKYTTRKGDITILSYVRSFAVVREGYGYCWAVPINAYNGKGLLKPGLGADDVQAHALIHDSHKRPMMLRNEPRLSKTPIAVDLSEEAETLADDSLINFSKVTTVEHNVRAMAVGKVSRSSYANFVAYWREHLLN